MPSAACCPAARRRKSSHKFWRWVDVTFTHRDAGSDVMARASKKDAGGHPSHRVTRLSLPCRLIGCQRHSD
eukprot:6462382-Amphidinium_carterae.2